MENFKQFIQNMIHEKPYEKLALIYDQLMSHVNYKLWAEYLRNLFQYANRKIKTVADLSVGTGNLTSFLNSYGFECYGSDKSYPMILQARQKSELSNLSFIVSDAIHLPYERCKFDAVLFLYDSLNYITSKKSVDKLLLEVNGILNKGGVFIFDVITDLLCKNHYNNFREDEKWNNSGYERHGYYDQENNIQYNEFHITIDGQKYYERHYQKVYSQKDLIQNLQKHGFKVLARLDDFTYLTANENSERIHYVCLKQ